MKARWLSLVFGVACSLLFTQPAQCDDETQPALMAGFAERDITPEIGMERPGGYGKAFHQSIHDPCKVRAAVFDDGETRVAVVSVDALLVQRRLVQAARKRIHQACGIEPSAVLIHATHSHSSGPSDSIYPGDFDHADEFVQRLAYEQSPNADLDYVAHLEDQVVDAVCAADESKSTSVCSVGVGREDKAAFNRRFRMRDGYTYTHPGVGNPDIIEPAGPIDPDVGVIGAWDAAGNLKGCLVNYVCHATTNPGGASANYVYYLEQVIRGVFGEEVIVVFLAGASGDVTQVNNLAQFASPGGEQWARLVGGRVGAEAVKVLLTEEPGVLTPVVHKSKTWMIARRVPNPERVAKSYEIMRQDPPQVDAVTRTFAKEIVLLDALLERETEVEVEVQAIQIGPAVLLTDPAEFFCQLGLDIKAGSPFPVTFPVSLANGCVGYVPTEEAFGPRGGGYETRLTSYANVEITAGTQMVEAAVELANSLTPGELPTRGPAPQFQQNPWAYGAVPPELE